MGGEKAALYVRLSEEDRDKDREFKESRSIVNQKSLLVTYARENGFQIAGIYSDEDYTGSDRNRPMFRKLIKDASLGKFSVVLCKSQSRFTREMELVEKYIHGLFPLWGVRFIGVVDRADTLVPGNKKARQINGLVNEWYLEDLSDSIKSVLNDLRSKGKHIGAFAPYGYKKDPENKGRLLPDEPAARVVQEIFFMYVNGTSKLNIARYLNEKNIPTPAMYKSRQSLKWKNSSTKSLPPGEGGIWHYYTVAAILENPVYAGTMVQGKKKTISYKSSKTVKTEPEEWFVVENTHEAVIDRETWEKAEGLRKARSRPAYKKENMEVFSGKVYCGFCGKKLRKAYHCRKDIKKVYYRCPLRLMGEEYCKGTSLLAEKLKKTAVREFIDICSAVFSRKEIEKLCVFELDSESEEKSRLEARIKNISLRKERLKEISARSYMDKALGVIGDEEYCAVRDRLKSEREALLTEERSVGEHIEKIKTDMERKLGSDGGSFLNRLKSDEELINAVCAQLIDKVIVYGHEEKSRRAVIEFNWDF